MSSSLGNGLLQKCKFALSTMSIEKKKLQSADVASYCFLPWFCKTLHVKVCCFLSYFGVDTQEGLMAVCGSRTHIGHFVGNRDFAKESLSVREEGLFPFSSLLGACIVVRL
ncbi:hypothetical protein FXO38_08605 [Capsicum annuum]|nr:hypothetical protein FXO37_24304 [Capsicum annuum]KAF3667466.1 hypothetical protein FXO38_08605 [Capsicum annuum]